MTESRIARIVAAYVAQIPAAARCAVQTAKWVAVLIVFLVAPYLWTGVQLALATKV